MSGFCCAVRWTFRFIYDKISTNKQNEKRGPQKKQAKTAKNAEEISREKGENAGKIFCKKQYGNKKP